MRQLSRRARHCATRRLPARQKQLRPGASGRPARRSLSCRDGSRRLTYAERSPDAARTRLTGATGGCTARRDNEKAAPAAPQRPGAWQQEGEFLMQHAGYPQHKASVLDLARARTRRHAGSRTVTKRELAAELGCSTSTIDRWQREPSFPVIRPYGKGLMVRYRAAEVRAWRANRDRVRTVAMRPAGEARRERVVSLDARRRQRDARIAEVAE